MACHSLRNISEFYYFATQDQLYKFSEWIFVNANFDGVAQFLLFVSLGNLRSVFLNFLNLKFHGLRFIGILIIFLQLFEVDSCSIYSERIRKVPSNLLTF